MDSQEPLSVLFNSTLFNPASPYYDAKLDPDNALHYVPNLGANIFFLIGFAFTSLVIAAYLARTWRKTAPLLTLLVASVGETLGFAMRVVYHYNVHSSMTIYIIEFVCVVLSPLAIAAALYIIAGRLIRFILKIKPIFSDDKERKPFWLRCTKWSVTHLGLIFILSDVTTFLIQAAGGGLLLTDKRSLILTGKNILLAGLILQLASFAIFSALSALIISLFRSSSLPMKNNATSLFESHIAFRGTTLCLVVSSVMILIRSAFRVAEFSSGFDGPIATNEGLFLGLDSTVCLISLLVWCWWSRSSSSHAAQPVGDVEKPGHPRSGFGRWSAGVGWPTWVFVETARFKKLKTSANV